MSDLLKCVIISDPVILDPLCRHPLKIFYDPLFYYTNDNHLWKHSDSASPRGVSFNYSTEGDKTDLLERCQLHVKIKYLTWNFSYFFGTN